MCFTAVVALLLAAQGAIATPFQNEKRQFPPNIGFNWGGENLRGVNLGGWLVLESFITPSIFESVNQSLGIQDEWTLSAQLPTTRTKHLAKSLGNLGHSCRFQKDCFDRNEYRQDSSWVLGNDNANTPFVSGSAAYIDKVIDWARQTGLKVLIDLHGAPGSQNRWEHSGQAMTNPGWLVDGGANDPTSQRTLNVLNRIAQKYADPSYNDIVVAIELLNEPKGWVLNEGDLRQFYLLHDVFYPPNHYNGFMTPQDSNDQYVALDHHYYQNFDDYTVGLATWKHRQMTCNTADQYWGADKWTIVGEWSAAMTDCAKYLNGYYSGARYDGAMGCSTFYGSFAGMSSITAWDQDYKNDTRMFIEGQMNTFEANSQGWIFWNFKTETADEWSLFALLNAGLFPSPVTSRNFPPSCDKYW